MNFTSVEEIEKLRERAERNMYHFIYSEKLSVLYFSSTSLAKCVTFITHNTSDTNRDIKTYNSRLTFFLFWDTRRLPTFADHRF